MKFVAPAYSVKTFLVMLCTAVLSINAVQAQTIQFLVVNGKRNGSLILINWEVMNEKEVINYFIERSYNGIDFFTAGLVGNNPVNGNTRKYTFSDAPAGKKAIVFYRIKAQDAAGRNVFSKVISVKPVLDEVASEN